MQIVVNLNVDAPPAGPPGADGKDGKPGPTMIKTIVEKRTKYLDSDVPMGTGARGGVFYLAKDTAFVSVRFKTFGVKASEYKERRVFFQQENDYTNRTEIDYGNAYLRLNNTENSTLERISLSMERTLIEVPPSVDGEGWGLVINDKGDVGFELWDLGLRHVLRRIENIDDIEEVSYSEPY
jgi:hypothetical protein